MRDFDPKAFVRPRKSLKVMSRDIQLAFAAADLATSDARLPPGSVAPERLGVVFGAEMIYTDVEETRSTSAGCLDNGIFQFSNWARVALSELYPLWMLKYLPNMPACHIGIAQDARGPSNSLVQGELSSLAALLEAKRTIERGLADAMIVGGTSTSRLHPCALCFRGEADLSHRNDAPEAACRPFDADRDGLVNGEGAAAFVLESRQHADARGAKVIARVAGGASRFESRNNGQYLQCNGISQAIDAAISQAGLQAQGLGHVNANGLGTIEHDRIEAQAIRQGARRRACVRAEKLFRQSWSAATGAVELVASLLAMANGVIPPTLNYEHHDPECPVNVIHDSPREIDHPTMLALNFTAQGPAAAVVLIAES